MKEELRGHPVSLDHEAGEFGCRFSRRSSKLVQTGPYSASVHAGAFSIGVAGVRDWLPTVSPGTVVSPALGIMLCMESRRCCQRTTPIGRLARQRRPTQGGHMHDRLPWGCSCFSPTGVRQWVHGWLGARALDPNRRTNSASDPLPRIAPFR